MKGRVLLNGHLFDLQVWTGMGEGWEDLVAWCKTCDPTGSSVIDIDLRNLDGPVSDGAQELMRLMWAHAYEED